MIDLHVNQNKKIFDWNIENDQIKDSGMAAVLILLLLGYFLEARIFFVVAIPVLLINMIWPAIYKPFALLWIIVSFILGNISSKVILAIVFLLLLTPVGLFRKLLGKDQLQLKKWKKDKTSVFVVRNYSYQPKDIENPY